MKLRTISIVSLAIAAMANFACSKEVQAAKGDFITKTIEVGFEDSEPASKTYLANNAKIYWSSSGTDKIIYVFDTDGNRYDFTSTETGGKPTRSFSCNTWPTEAKVKMVLWSGKSSSSEKSVINGWTVSGESLAIKTTQAPSMSSSFDATTGIAVMKPGDAKMRQVLGYLRYNIGKFPSGSSAAIKSVKVSADENIAGTISIDYSGDEPVATIVSGGVKSITANTRYANKNGVTYEPGYVYVGMLPGTYHNVKLTITAFAADPTTKEAATIDPFTVSLPGEMVIARGKFTAVAHTLPNEKPEPAQVDPWPNEPTAFDYGLQPGVARRASYDTEELADYGVASSPSDKRAVNQPVISNNVTYGGPGLSFYGNRMVCEKVNSWTTAYPNVIPDKRYISFKINRPGRIKFYGAPWGGTIPTFSLAVVKTVDGVTTAKVVQTLTPTEVADASQTENRTDSNINSDGWAKYWNTMTISEEDIAGIDEAATVYLYHSAAQVHYWPFYWTSDENNPINPSSKKKFLLASDSVCRTNSQSEYPRAGWGQKLADTLGHDAEVMNLAVGGRSTKSFITNGHWAGLLSSTYAGDVVVIEFGVNDSSTNSEKHTELDGSSTEEYQGIVVGNFQPNLKRMIADVQAKGAIPVLCTTTNSRSFTGSTPNETVPSYNAAIRSVATELGVAFIDVNLYHRQWLQSVGYEGSEAYYVTNKLDPSQNDNTHITHEGAKVVAGIVGDHLKALGLWQ